ncbi:MAG: hypothetical protein CMJ92_00855 [Planctomycetes bacterium]|nr:hypothetical protein [Planctomycetota bacterium]
MRNPEKFLTGIDLKISCLKILETQVSRRCLSTFPERICISSNFDVSSDGCLHGMSSWNV